MIQTINEMIDYLIKNSDEVADIVICYTTHGDEMVVSTNTRDIITTLGMLSYGKEILLHHERCDS